MKRLIPLDAPLGAAPDRELARRYGVCPGAIGRRRKRLGIPAYGGDRPEYALPQARAAYDLAADDAALSWDEIALRLGYTKGSSAQTAASTYAAAHPGLRWPLPRSLYQPGSGLTEQIYLLAKARPELSWDEIAVALEVPGRNPANNAYARARYYAAREGLRWPLQRRERP